MYFWQVLRLCLIFFLSQISQLSCQRSTSPCHARGRFCDKPRPRPPPPISLPSDRFTSP
ncbi:hypothetical protein MKW94_011979 [Papaver nudicaule]|uniref:Uncharacterized protein n=1 Tax=Papaver nudicaule TaxID=74823 RepID=A0AA41RX88_PAPNU|nr:hypothetical protein [Papaver nudicaule]MCL7039185.1 hypothetical protein [Papaver nudicaule]